MKRTLVTILLVVGACAARDARADEPRGERAIVAAKQLAARAQVHYDLGEYPEAVSAYREAYRLHPSPGLLYNLGQAYRLMGDCVSATTMYRNYLRLAPRSPYKGLVRQHLATLEPCFERQSGSGTERHGEGEQDVVLAASPGKQGRIAGLGGLSDEGDEARDDGAPHPGRTKKRAGIALGAGGAALIAVGAYFALDAMQTADEVAERHGMGESWRKLEALDARGRRSESLGLSLFAAGGVAAASGAILYVLGRREDKRAAGVTVTPVRAGTGVAVSWEF